mmetsp:Transcript_63047/g.112027  ORF Transcript_63047/g.112027 Transcript_63047/m.112027 type:complete len:233 (+) Transcript_63047:451-1149(+)
MPCSHFALLFQQRLHECSSHCIWFIVRWAKCEAKVVRRAMDHSQVSFTPKLSTRLFKHVCRFLVYRVAVDIACKACCRTVLESTNEGVGSAFSVFQLLNGELFGLFASQPTLFDGLLFCAWSTSFRNRGENDLEVLVTHLELHPSCCTNEDDVFCSHLGNQGNSFCIKFCIAACHGIIKANIVVPTDEELGLVGLNCCEPLDKLFELVQILFGTCDFFWNGACVATKNEEVR